MKQRRHRGGPPATAARALARGCGEQRLGRYTDRRGREREVVALAGADGSMLVVDRDAIAFGASLLVAHLAADEPADNALLICTHYLADASRGRCRMVAAADLQGAPVEEDEEPVAAEKISVGSGSREFRLQRLDGARSIPDLRWVELVRGRSARAVSVRKVVASLQSYEPVRSITRATLLCHRGDPRVSVCVLRAELERVEASHIVLNRGLREAVLTVMREQRVSASEIAIRCGRMKRDARGNVVGETSWLARRVGLAPESGDDAPTPWIHSDVLGLIARQGLGLSPCEVELG